MGHKYGKGDVYDVCVKEMSDVDCNQVKRIDLTGTAVGLILRLLLNV
jgi:hypothetical protein